MEQRVPRNKREAFIHSMTASQKQCWVIHDGNAGNRKPALALCVAMGWIAQEIVLRPSTFANWFSPRVFPGAADALGNDLSTAIAQLNLTNVPKYAIGCGRQAALATRLLKKTFNTFAIQLLNPRINSSAWDVVIAPEHDALHGNNVINIKGSLHGIDHAFLKQAHTQYNFLSALPSPRTAVLIGGPSNMANMHIGVIEVMLSQLEYTLAQQGGSLMICGSRRTPPEFAQLVRERFIESQHRIWFDDSDGDNFYPGALAWADRIIVTPDSVNMISEACATAAPVFIAQTRAAQPRMQKFLHSLLQLQRIAMQSKELPAFTVTPLETMTPLTHQLKKYLPAD
jgi:uncharacterized protein